jgi:outer membrane protein OmpA-like peptidoglycan-associated protein
MRWALMLAVIGLGCGARGQQPPAQEERAAIAEPKAPPLDAAPLDAPIDIDDYRRITITDTDRCGLFVDQIYFTRGSPVLRRQQGPILDATATMFRCLREDCTTLQIEVSGHTSITEPTPDKLSLDRATAVRDALVARGVTPTILTVKANGAREPIDARPSAMAFAKNQRVEFRVESTGC